MGGVCHLCVSERHVHPLKFSLIDILLFRYTDRKKNAVHHFKMALSMDPLMWAAYEELCILGMYDDIYLISGAHWAYLMKYELIGDDLVFSFWSN